MMGGKVDGTVVVVVVVSVVVGEVVVPLTNSGGGLLQHICLGSSQVMFGLGCM